jgi:ubiquinone/menaquinone biosynthesis C-methylase UbiE
MDQRYVIEESVQHRYVGNRDARTFLPFLLPHVRPGMDVLDAGCGVGSIALDLAPTVAPGRIVGIDADSGQIDIARRSAAEQAIDNAEFVTASVYELPFDDASFDVVYANAVLLYVREPVRALAEMRRILRPGGLAAASDDDLGTVVISPDRPELELAPRLFARAVAHEGGNARYSRHLRTLMLEAGFARTQGVAHAPEVYGDAAGTRWFAEFATGVFGAPSMTEVIIREGWATRAELDALLAAIREWGDLPDAFAAWLYCGALGWTADAAVHSSEVEVRPS